MDYNAGGGGELLCARLPPLIFTRNSQEIGIIFGALCVAILFRTMFALVSRWFYAQKDTRTPLLVSVFVIALNVVLAYSLSRPDSYGVEGLAIAQSIVAAVEVLVLVYDAEARPETI